MKKTLAVVAVSTLLAGLSIAAYALYDARRSGAFDSRLQEALSAVQDVQNYEAAVVTETILSDRRIVVSGLYRLDFEHKRYASHATTTLFVPDDRKKTVSHDFTLENLSIDDNVYVRINTESPFLKKTIPADGIWHRFRTTEIPSTFTDIAVSGPVLDNLALLSTKGSYLSLQAPPTSRELDGATYYVYEFSLSKKAAQVSGGTLGSLMKRIGNGYIELWIDDASRIRIMAFGGENYRSTTTVLGVNTPLDIAPPVITE